MGVEKCIFGAVMTIQVSEERDSGLSPRKAHCWRLCQMASPYPCNCRPDGLFHRRGVFYVMGKVPVKPLGVFALLRLPAELFSARVLAMLKKEGLIDDTFIANLMKWRHTSGFSVYTIQSE